MATRACAPTHSVGSTTVADLLERILDKGIVIVGDIKIDLVQVELLTIKIRLLICSVDRAKEIGMDWWSHKNPDHHDSSTNESILIHESLSRMEKKLKDLEAKIGR
ncbi:MAG: gas vesicle protein GvpA [Legionellales bacterium RIFCSPHIGHO2_12_FULL_42_9]|nr:MAG: gas vesicle protein GvpA [Legionellales bacterium RIFCSPHIGHO2_12_FULL_42_9]